KLRESVPAHVKPTAQWLAFNQRLLQGEASLATLNEPGFYDPEKPHQFTVKNFELKTIFADEWKPDPQTKQVIDGWNKKLDKVV
ncbi:hypothetical protein ONJ95_27075, partial [Salmonella enterica subsp. enterica serovar Virginia]|nr:hypothetical protein [Salmonella enterica subsp. enterica serovar Virginia]